jgi:hypothetical protein
MARTLVVAGHPRLNYEKLVVWVAAIILPWSAIAYAVIRVIDFLN